MTHPASALTPEDDATRESTPIAPSWARRWVASGVEEITEADGCTIRRQSTERATLLTITLRDARDLSAGLFEQRSEQAYRLMQQIFRDDSNPHILRIWNYIPGIGEIVDQNDGRDTDRYMTFNAGRFAAMRAWYESIQSLHDSVPAGTGVGHGGDDLIIHALSGRSPGIAVQNPGQIPSFAYSEKYGRLPPCFARATAIDWPMSCLLLAGTAAIEGERSCFIGNLAGQFELTLRNIRAVIAEAAKKTGCSIEPALHNARIYAPLGVDRRQLEGLTTQAREFFQGQPEFVTADLCRRDLLVEIEGIAPMEPS